MDDAQRYLITDVGSTTTKAVTFEKQAAGWELTGLAGAATTVEKPNEDVMVGVEQAVHALPAAQDKPGYFADGKKDSHRISADWHWLSTSSAGGGLQILVIGLTRQESAASAQRAAFGAGGVILDTISIDDGRSVVEQMLEIEQKQPDIILMSGGYEGGAYASVLRQAEILSYCHIRPKYGLHNRIPLIYAGNSAAVDAIRNILGDEFEVHILPNVRPSEGGESISPVTELIHELFLSKVMQQAPGYAELSSQVVHPVIPTPVGVLKALELLSRSRGHNTLAVDIGGATTDVYSNMHGKFYRTVSANYGMSYNLLNVYAKSDKRQLSRSLYPDLREDEVRDYAANKMLHPTRLPADDKQLHIEQALARQALQLSLQQHLEMSFNVQRMGHFIKLKHDDLDPFHEQFFRDKLDERMAFRLSDYDTIIGAGGVISNAPDRKQAAIMLVDGLQPRGITELYRDRHFITPHLGKLSEVDAQAAEQLLRTDCLEQLCLCVRPMSHKLKAGRTALSVRIKSASGEKIVNVPGNDLMWIANKEQVKVHVKGLNGVQVSYDTAELERETNMDILIDTRLPEYGLLEMNKALNLYRDIRAKEEIVYPVQPRQAFSALSRTSRRVFSLPYMGKIFVSKGDKVTPDTLLAENQYDPPHLYVLQVFRGMEQYYDQETFRRFLLVKVGDVVKRNQLIYHETTGTIRDFFHSTDFDYYAPVRGRVDKIDFANGTVLMREIQDYSFEPAEVDMATQLKVKPKYIKGYMNKHKGDFINEGDLIATRYLHPGIIQVHSEWTGTLTDINEHKGIVIIRYQKKDLQLFSGLHGTVTEVLDSRSVEVEYDAITLEGSIGFGLNATGSIRIVDNINSSGSLQGVIAVLTKAPAWEEWQQLSGAKPAAVVLPSMPEAWLPRILGYELGVGITGNERLAYPFIIMQGFGNMTLSAELSHAFVSLQGRHAAVLPSTQIRAGVVRPSIIIQNI